MELTKYSAVELGKAIRQGKVSVTEAVQAYLDEIRRKENCYHCYITVLEKEALQRAAEVEQKLRWGEYAGSLLAGVPVAVKDNICVQGVRTTCASKMLSDFVPPYDAEVTARLTAAGAVILGKTNLDEFAMGSTTETSWFGATKNPCNPEHVPGGSSGGSAAAVAAGEAALALGSDTGGSIRQPCSFCGITGLKPTYGSVSRYGLVAYASSLDQIGPMGRNIEDCAALLTVISGHDSKDSTCVGNPGFAYEDSMGGDIRGMKIGIPVEYFREGLSGEVRDSVLAAAQVLKDCGIRLEEIHLKTTDYAVPAYYVLACAEAGSNLSRYDGVKYGYRAPEYEGLSEMYEASRSTGFGMEVKRRLMIGAFALSSGYYDAYYNKALKVKALVKEEYDRAFENVDLILTPVSPGTAPRLGESLNDPLKMYLSDIYTVPVNLAGLPAASIPCGVGQDGLPIGFQLIGRPFGETQIIRTAYRYEQARGLKRKGGCGDETL